MKQKPAKTNDKATDPLLPQVEEYLTKFSFPLASIISRKFKIGFSRAEKILREIEVKKRENT